MGISCNSISALSHNLILKIVKNHIYKSKVEYKTMSCTIKYRLHPLVVAISCILLTNIVHATTSLTNDENQDDVENVKEAPSVNLGIVKVYGDVTDYIGISNGLSATEVGKSTLNQAQIDVMQANNMASVIDKVPGVSMAGSPRPGGQVVNIWGMKDSKNVPITLDGALKTFDKYQQGNLYVDPDLVKQVTVNKGAFNPAVGNGGFGGNVEMKTKDAQDFLRADEKLGAFLKSGFHTNNDQYNYASAVFAETDNEKVDGLFYFARTDAGDIRLADHEKYRGSSYQQNSYLLKTNFRPIADSKITLTLANTRFKGWMPFAAMGGNTITFDPNDDYDWKRRIFYRDQRDKTYSLNAEYAPVDNPFINFKGDIAYSETKQHDEKIKPMPGQKAPSILLSTFGEENWTTYKTANVHLRNSS